MAEHRYNLTDATFTEVSAVHSGDNPGAEIVLHKAAPDDEEERIIREAVEKVRAETGPEVKTMLQKAGTVPRKETEIDMVLIALQRRPDLAPDAAVADFQKSADGQELRRSMVEARAAAVEPQNVSETPLDKQMVEMSKSKGISIQEAYSRLTG